VALSGDLPSALALLKADYPALAVLAKATISFPLVYHYAGGMRHVVWDLHKIGKQTDATSLLETATVEKSSQILVGVSAVIAAIVAVL
jgi:succinate dehydrogenase (ubiquinone) cytochrome b560 subunit